jgi:hypothetical protein
MRDLFRIAFVHLTAVGFNEKLGHRAGEMIHGPSAFATARLSAFQVVDLSD